MNLYNKYRPKTFEEMVGDKNQFESLQQLMEKKDKPHVYLFYGEAGCGKTTASKICASMLGAEKTSIVEINTANNRGIDTARSLIENLNYKSIFGTNTVYIINEVHKTTNDWQNAMLDPLEFVPGHVYFFLTTTNPEKLIKPLKSRCTEYHFAPLTEKQNFKLLKRIMLEEDLDIDRDLLHLISEKCEGSPRKALVLLEKIIGMEENEARQVIKKGIQEEDKNVIDLCRALLGKDTNWGAITKIIKELQSQDIESVRWAVMGYMSSVLLSGKRNDKAAIILEAFSEPFYDSGKNGLVLASYQSYFV